jgi:hypothetical protein
MIVDVPAAVLNMYGTSLPVLVLTVSVLMAA